MEARVSSGLLMDGGSGYSSPGRHGVGHRSSWRRSPLAPLTRQADDPQTEEQLYQRGSHTAVKVQVPQQIYQPRDMAKGLRTLGEFDFAGRWGLITELPQGWGKRPLEGTTKPCVHQDPGERGSDPTRD